MEPTTPTQDDGFLEIWKSAATTKTPTESPKPTSAIDSSKTLNMGLGNVESHNVGSSIGTWKLSRLSRSLS